jgi:hypothetical protein
MAVACVSKTPATHGADTQEAQEHAQHPRFTACLLSVLLRCCSSLDTYREHQEVPDVVPKYVLTRWRCFPSKCIHRVFAAFLPLLTATISAFSLFLQSSLTLAPCVRNIVCKMNKQGSHTNCTENVPDYVSLIPTR